MRSRPYRPREKIHLGHAAPPDEPSAPGPGRGPDRDRRRRLVAARGARAAALRPPPRARRRASGPGALETGDRPQLAGAAPAPSALGPFGADRRRGGPGFAHGPGPG